MRCSQLAFTGTAAAPQKHPPYSSLTDNALPLGGGSGTGGVLRDMDGVASGVEIFFKTSERVGGAEDWNPAVSKVLTPQP